MKKKCSVAHLLYLIIIIAKKEIREGIVLEYLKQKNLIHLLKQ